ncbi:MAG: FlxA-like family protein, partial [Rhodoluna sp.]
MANNKQKTLEQQIRDLEAQIEKLTEQATVEWPSKELGEKIEAKIISWFRNDEFFAVFRNTFARAIITLLSIVVLFGYGYYAFMNPELSLWYLGLICLVLVMQAVSVR